MLDTVTNRSKSALAFLFLLTEAIYLPARPRDSWLLLLVSGVIALIFFQVMHRLFGKVHFLSLPGAWGFVAGGIIALLALWVAYSDIVRLSLFFSKTAFPHLSRAVVVILILLTAIIFARGGREALLRWAFPTAIVLLIPLLLSLVMTVTKWQPEQLLPLTQGTPSEFADAVLVCFRNVYLPLLFPFLLLSGRNSSPFTAGILCSGTLISLTAARNMMLLGAFTSAKVSYPTYAAAGLVAVGDFFQRAESLIAGCLTVCVLGRLAVLFLVAARAFRPYYVLLHREKPADMS